MSLKNYIIEDRQFASKCPYTMNPIGITIHNTANDASAINEADNVDRPNNYAEVSFHIAVDDKEALLIIPLNRNAWHAGDGSLGTGNRKYIAVEICYSKSGGDRFIKAEERAVQEVAALCKQYGWTTANIKAHRDFSGKNCPHRTDINSFKQRVAKALNSNNEGEPDVYITNIEQTFKNMDDRIRDKIAIATRAQYVYDAKGNALKINGKEFILTAGTKVKMYRADRNDMFHCYPTEELSKAGYKAMYVARIATWDKEADKNRLCLTELIGDRPIKEVVKEVVKEVEVNKESILVIQGPTESLVKIAELYKDAFKTYITD